MRISILVLVFSVFSSSFLYAQGIDKCAFMRTKQARIQEMRNALVAMQELQAERAKAREIRDLIVDTEDARAISLLAEALDDEASALQSDQTLNRNIAIGSGLGSVILAGLLVKRMKSSFQGASLLQRLISALKAGNKQAVGKILTGGFVISLASTFWFASRSGEISDKREFLGELIGKLNQLKDLAQQILTLSEELEQEEIAFGLRAEQLQAEGLDVTACLAQE